MSNTPLTQIIKADMKLAMKARDKDTLGTIRLILAEFKRIEVDERIEVDDTRALAVLDKMVKQRRDSEQQFLAAGRDELAAQETMEIATIQGYLPSQLSEAEILELIQQAIAKTGAEGMQGMGQVMGVLKPQLQGRADAGAVSQQVKQVLTS